MKRESENEIIVKKMLTEQRHSMKINRVTVNNELKLKEPNFLKPIGQTKI